MTPLIETVIIVALALGFLNGCWTLVTLYKDFRSFVKACRYNSFPENQSDRNVR